MQNVLKCNVLTERRYVHVFICVC